MKTFFEELKLTSFYPMVFVVKIKGGSCSTFQLIESLIGLLDSPKSHKKTHRFFTHLVSAPWQNWLLKHSEGSSLIEIDLLHCRVG